MPVSSRSAATSAESCWLATDPRGEPAGQKRLTGPGSSGAGDCAWEAPVVILAPLSPILADAASDVPSDAASAMPSTSGRPIMTRTARFEENAMPAPIRIALRIPGTSPLPRLLELIQSVEDAGFDGAGILDSQLLCRDVFITLALAASQTSRLTLFPAVTNPFTRHVSVLAGAMQTAEELAPGRVHCVIGTGYTSAHTIGRKPATLAEMRQAIVELRALLNGDTVTFHARSGRLQFASGRRIPVLMAASGPKSIELAGEVADGVML